MDAFETILAGIAANAGLLVPILYTLLVAALIDTVTGLWAAFNSGTLNGQYVAEFVRSHLLQRITPIFTGLIAGVAVGGTDTAAGTALVTAAGAAGAAYLAETIASVTANLRQGAAGTKGLPTP